MSVYYPVKYIRVRTVRQFVVTVPLKKEEKRGKKHELNLRSKNKDCYAGLLNISFDTLLFKIH